MKRIIWRDKFRRITENNGRRVVEVEWEDGENHQSVRRDAAAVVAQHIGVHASLGVFLDVVYRRRFDGHPARYRRYAINDSK